MPWAARHACAHAGCRALVPRGTYRCPVHTKQSARQQVALRRADPARRAALAFYSTPAWRALRREQLLEFPLCADHQARGYVVGAVHADHVVPIARGGAPLDRGNLQSLCHPCHSAKTSREGGRW